MSFTQGMRLTCQDDVLAELTYGHDYYVIESRYDAVLVLNDAGKEVWYHNTRFVSSVELLNASGSAAQVIENEHVYMYDVDDTLVMRDDQELQPGTDRLEIIDPYTSTPIYVKAHVRHIQLLKQMHGRGRFVVVWSQSGALWAQAVVKALGLGEYVNLIMTKPSGYVDDLPCTAWLSNRIYLTADKQEAT